MEVSEESNVFFTLLERDLNFEIPPHVKNSLW